MKVSRIIFIALIMLGSLPSFAQTHSIKVSVSKNTILLGEPFELKVKIDYPVNSIKKSLRIDSIPHFEFLSEPVYDSSDYDGMVRISAYYQLTSFDSGHWVIPSIILNNRVKSDTLPIDVVFSPFNPELDYHDIKTIIEVAPPKKKQWWFWAAGAVIVLGVVIYYLSTRKKPEKKPVSVVQVNAYDEAMKQLEGLQQSKMDPKSWHSALTDIFRRYIFRRKGIFSLQKTTDDLVVQLRQLAIEKEVLEKLSQSLRLSDFVKFAKYIPSVEDNNQAFDVIKNTIIQIEGSETKKAQE